MRNALRLLGMLTVLAGLLAFPLVALAQDVVAPAADGGGIPLAPIILVLSILAAILPFTAKLPGWGRVVNGALPIILAFSDQLADIATTNPKMALTSLVLNAIGLVSSKLFSAKRASS